MKILCICPIGIGNYLLVYPAMRQLRDYLPDAELHLLALRGGIKGIAGSDPLWKKVHVIDPTKDKSKVKQLSFINELRKEHFDVSLSYFASNNWQYFLFPFLCGIPRRYNYKYTLQKMSSLPFLANCTIPVDPELHDIKQCIRLTSFFCNVESDYQNVKFPQLFTDTDFVNAKEYTAAHSSKKVHIGIHAGSSAEHGMDCKRWAPERFGELADRICKELDADAFVFGGPEESALKEDVAKQMKSPVHNVKYMDLQGTSALVKQCTLFLCNDSGLMHIAACSGVPVAAVFGPTSEKRNGPAGNGHCIIRKEMPGFPVWTAANVGNRSLDTGIDPMASLKALTVEEAWKIVKPWLNK